MIKESIEALLFEYYCSIIQKMCCHNFFFQNNDNNNGTGGVEFYLLFGKLPGSLAHLALCQLRKERKRMKIGTT